MRFKPVAGEVDRAAGIAVRLSDPNNYYVVRANALEDNVRLYRMVSGQRSQFAGANAKVPSGKWQELRLVARGSRFEVFLDGKSLYSATDTTIAGRRPRGAVDQGRQRHAFRRSQNPDLLGEPTCNTISLPSSAVPGP